jgi:hypothetical protein
MQYLYGASVQGIQNFIFQTDKLTEIVGASNLVEQICTTFFKDEVGNSFNPNNLIIGAAGNIKYLFDTKSDCEHIVKTFPMQVMLMAHGITISQAVVPINDNLTSEHLQVLETNLRTQRSRQVAPHGLGLMIAENARRTGNPSVNWKKNAAIDLAQQQKQQASDPANRILLKKLTDEQKIPANRFPFDISDISKTGKNNWIAVVHADGNNLGKLLMGLGENIQGDIKAAFREFSETLDKATIAAAKQAFDDVVLNTVKDNGRIPFRPVLLGGDDLTVIIRGDLAMKFTKVFLAQFEMETQCLFSAFAKTHGLQDDIFKNGLTACAGIAYIKTNYPFHYGVNLAESLCKEAKKIAKNINAEHTPSCLMFHKVHASFVEEYSDIVEKELFAKSAEVHFNNGPYFVKQTKNYDTIDALEQKISRINYKDAPKAGLRNWLTELQNNAATATQLLARINTISKDTKYFIDIDKPFITRDNKKHTPIFDIISLSNI